MERRTNNYDVKFGRIRINFDKIEVQPGKYYTRDESDAIFLKVSEITRYIDFNKPDFNPTEELVNVYINGRGYKIPETKIDNDTIKKNSEGQLYADIKQTEYIAGKNITLTDKEGNIKEISAGTDEEVTKELESLRDDLDEVDDYTKGHEKRIEDLEGSKLTESDTITIKTDNSINIDLTIDYNSENKRLSLKDKKGNVVSEIDASIFVKDGMLDSVELYSIGDDTYLRFVFNTTSGKEDINVKVTELIDIYEGQGCIDITDKTVSIKYDSSKLSVNTQGNLTLAEDYLKNISKGTDGTYVTTEISQKSNGNQTIGTSVKVQAISSANEANNGLVEAKDVKEYVTNQINAIPKEKCLPLVDDLDSYNCPVGTIVKYNGETNEKYVNGWDYKKVEGGEDSDTDTTLQKDTITIYVSPNVIFDNESIKKEINENPYFFKYIGIPTMSYGGVYFYDVKDGELPTVGGFACLNGGHYDELSDITKIIGISENYWGNPVIEFEDGNSQTIGSYTKTYFNSKFYYNSYNFGISIRFNFNETSVTNDPKRVRLNKGSVIRLQDGTYLPIDTSDGESGIFKPSENIELPRKPSWIQHNAQPDVSGQVSNLETTVANNSQNILSLQSGKQDKITTTNKLSYDLLKDTPQIPTVPTKLSEFTDDLSIGKNPTHTHNQYLTSYTETDPTVPSHVKAITQQNITDWNNAHIRNNDTQLTDGSGVNNAKLKVESNKISATLPIVSSGDIEGVGTDNKHHLLSKKMDSNMFRVYNSFADMVADTQRPAGCWCAIIE